MMISYPALSNMAVSVPQIFSLGVSFNGYAWVLNVASLNSQVFRIGVGDPGSDYGNCECRDRSP